MKTSTIPESGSDMYFLIANAKNKTTAIIFAESSIGNLFECGDLDEGDLGYVRTKGPKEEYPLLSAEENQGQFFQVLVDLTAKRRERAAQYFHEAEGQMNQAGITRLEDIPVSETAQEPRIPNRITYNLITASEIARGVWTDRGVLWNPLSNHCGVTQEEIDEIRKNPKGWYLVPVVVG